MTFCSGIHKPSTRMGGDCRGFTLIELLVVIAIIGLLSAIVLASLKTVRAKGNDARRLSDMHAVVQALELYANDHNGLYPPRPSTDVGQPCGAGGTTCVDNLSVLVSSKYISALPKDPQYPFSDNNAKNYRYCTPDGSAAGQKNYILLMQNQALVSNQWCRPQEPFATTSDPVTHATPCAWGTFPACN